MFYKISQIFISASRSLYLMKRLNTSGDDERGSKQLVLLIDIIYMSICVNDRLI